MLKLCLIGLGCLFPEEMGKNDPVPFPLSKRVIS